jgi:ATP-dependent DNA helicase RecG
MGVVGRNNRTKFRDQVVRPLVQAGWLEMTIPDKPRSSKQRYRTTDAGKQALAEAGEEA